jgi:hypothetical protein
MDFSIRLRGQDDTPAPVANKPHDTAAPAQGQGPAHQQPEASHGDR